MAGHDHDHDHRHDHDHGSELSETQLRVRALETVLTEKGYIDPAALDAIVEAYETKIGPRNGAAVVAKAWVDPPFKEALLKDGSKAVATFGHVGRVQLGMRKTTDLRQVVPGKHRVATLREAEHAHGVVDRVGLRAPPCTELERRDTDGERPQA